MCRVTKLFTLFILMAWLTGCEIGYKPPKIPDLELREKWRNCQKVEKPSRLMVLACENYERQCAKRKKAGNLVCY